MTFKKRLAFLLLLHVSQLDKKNTYTQQGIISSFEKVLRDKHMHMFLKK